IQKLAAPWRSSCACTLESILEDGLDADETCPDATSIATAITATLADMTLRFLAPVDATNGTPFPFPDPLAPNHDAGRICLMALNAPLERGLDAHLTPCRLASFAGVLAL